METAIEIPKFLQHLKVFRSFPVPYTVVWVNGKPDFRIIDQEKAIQCYQLGLCSICGRTMLQFWFIGGKKSMESGMFTDGPMHRDCAKFSADTCPFLTGKRTTASTRPLPAVGDDLMVVCNEAVPKERPEHMAMRRASDYLLGHIENVHLVYQVRKWKSPPIWF